jgi:hypothetical protein
LERIQDMLQSPFMEIIFLISLSHGAVPKSTNAPVSPNYVNAGIYKIFSTFQPPAIADIPNLQSTLSSKTSSDRCQ